MEPTNSSASSANGADAAKSASTLSAGYQAEREQDPEQLESRAAAGMGATASTPGASDKSASSAVGSSSSYGSDNNAAGGSAATLRSQLSSMKSDLDALVNRAPSLSDNELTQAHARLMAQFSSLRYAAKGIATAATTQLNRGVETTQTYVKDKPMQSVAAAVGAGVLLGMLFKKRR